MPRLRRRRRPRVAGADDPGRHAGGDRAGRDRLAHDRARADDGVIADGHAVEDLGAGAEPDALAERDALRHAALLDHRARRIVHVVRAGAEVAVGGDQRLRPEGDPAGREDLAVEADVGAVAEDDVAALARQDRVAPDEHAAADGDALVPVALGVEQAVIVDHHVVADADAMRMAQGDVLAEDHAAAARAEQPGIHRLAQRQAERARHPLRDQVHQLVGQQRAPAGSADDQPLVLLARPHLGVEQLRLRRFDLARPAHSHPASRYQASVRPMPSRRPTRGA